MYHCINLTLESSSSSITVGTNNTMLLRSQGKVMFLHLSVCWGEGRHAIRFLLLNLPTLQMEMSEHVHQLTRQHTSTCICRSIILSHYDEQHSVCYSSTLLVQGHVYSGRNRDRLSLWLCGEFSQEVE